MRRCFLALTLLLTALVGQTLAGAQYGVVLAVTPTTITIDGLTETATYVVSNELLTNSVPQDAHEKCYGGKFSDVKTGCKIRIEYENRGGVEVCTHIKIQN